MAYKQIWLSAGKDLLANCNNLCSCQRPLSRSLAWRGYQKICRRELLDGQLSGLRTIFAGTCHRVAYYYKVIVHTGDRFAGGTDANVFIKLIGERGSTDELKLPAKQGDMERGMVNSYDILSEDIGPLKRLFVRHDNTGLGPAWYLEKIIVQNHAREKFAFHCNDWLKVSRQKGKLGLAKSLLEEEMKIALGSETAEEIETEATIDDYTTYVEGRVHSKLEKVLHEIIGDEEEIAYVSNMGQGARTSSQIPSASVVAASETTTQDENRVAVDISLESSADEIKVDGKKERKDIDKNTQRRLVTHVAVGDAPLSPAVRFLLDTYGLDRSLILATGPKGRILKGDVLQFIEKVGTPAQSMSISRKSQEVKITEVIPTIRVTEAEDKPSTVSADIDVDFLDIPNTNIRKTIAKRLTEAKTSIPHFYNSIDCDITKMLELRKRWKQDGILLTVNDFVVKSAALALQRIPEMNAQWDGEGVVMQDNIDISIAVSTDKGLLTPIIRDADKLELQAISTEIRNLAQKARDGKLMPPEFIGGTFTISNLGMFGLTQFSAIINPPQICIMAVGGTQQMVSEKGEIFSSFTVTLSCDGRALNEEITSRFLDTFKMYIENPYNTLTT